MPVKSKPSRPRRATPQTSSHRGLTDLALRACLVASDAVFNIRDFLAHGSRMALIAVRDCEKELDRIESEIDQKLPHAMTQVTEPEARELLACLRFSMELERIGDLLWGVALRAQESHGKLPREDSQQLLQITEILEKMLEQVRDAFTNRELEPAKSVLRADREIDEVHKRLVQRHLLGADGNNPQHTADVLLMAQALERAGDHATNLAEELFRLVEGRSLRHVPKKRVRD